MNISNGFYKAVQMRWGTFTFPVAEGTPVSAAGVEANSGDAIGIIPQSFTDRPLVPNCYILVSGTVSGCGYNLSDDAVNAMSGIDFIEKPKTGGSSLPDVSPDDAGKALVVSEEGEWEPGSALPQVNSNDHGSILWVWDGEWIPVRAFAEVYIDATENPPYVSSQVGIEYFFDSGDDIVPLHPMFANLWYNDSDGNAIAETCPISIAKNVYMGQTEVNASFVSPGLGWTIVWTRGGISISS